MNILILIISCCFLSCKENTKTNISSDLPIETISIGKSEEKIKSIESTISKSCDKYTFLNWVNIEEDRENRLIKYEVGSYKIELKRFLNEEENKAGKLLFINGTKIDFIENEFAHKPIIYSCKTSNQIILFVEESDESGSFAYRVYSELNDKFIYSGTLNIAPIEDNISFDSFIGLIKSENEIEIKLLVDSYFDSKSFENKQSSNLKASIVIESGKLKIK